MHRSSLPIIALLVGMPVLLAGGGTAVQQQPQNQDAGLDVSGFEYDVASIKLAKVDYGAGHISSGTYQPPDGFAATNITLTALIRDAYGYEDSQILGAPGWSRSDSYDVEAKMDDGVAERLRTLSLAQRALARQHMLQQLLFDRFKLAVHREERNLPVYFLLIAKSGFKLKESSPRDNYFAGARGAIGTRLRGPTASIRGDGIRVGALATTLTRILGRTVVDKTGLQGAYDIDLQWTQDRAGPAMVGDADGVVTTNGALGDTDTSISSALQDRLGLKLESGRGPVEVIVIDHVERPSEN